MIDRFQGVNGGQLADALLRQVFVQNKRELAEAFIAVGELLEFQTGQPLIVQDDGTNDVFLLVAGTVQVTVSGVETRTLTAGAHVGEMSAIHPSNPRSATVTATTNSGRVEDSCGALC
jgi:CRP/FNR family transcriptional regulator, cyclic AMP receptor protein